jgi:hypothetical protein
MESFDQSLKYLLHLEPADFIRFGLRDPGVQVVRPMESGLPSRGRDVDGGYLIVRDGKPGAVHVEFHRRHQSVQDLAVDVAEAQIRVFRRERVEIVSLVWDLYGAANEPVLEDRAMRYGRSLGKGGSEVSYVRVNLRGLGWGELLAQAPAALWPLVALTIDGTTEEAVHRAFQAIEARTDLTAGQRADHLAVLWFVAEAEDVPVRAMREYISEQRLMASTLYQEIFEKGKARAKAEERVETIIRLLMHWMGTLDAELRERIRAVSDLDMLKAWQDEALFLHDAEGAEQLAGKIGRALSS